MTSYKKFEASTLDVLLNHLCEILPADQKYMYLSDGLNIHLVAQPTQYFWEAKPERVKGLHLVAFLPNHTLFQVHRMLNVLLQIIF